VDDVNQLLATQKDLVNVHFFYSTVAETEESIYI